VARWRTFALAALAGPGVGLAAPVLLAPLRVLVDAAAATGKAA
jgi:hypothetical protein